MPDPTLPPEPGPPWECPLCDKPFPQIKRFVRHWFAMHSDETVGGLTLYADDLWINRGGGDQQEKEKLERWYKCWCDESFPTYTQLAAHIRRNGGPKAHVLGLRLGIRGEP